MTTKIKSGVISDNAITSAHISSGAISSSHLTSIDTDNITEGSSNLYFTTARVDSHLSGGTGVTYSSGAISIGQSVATSASPTFANLTLTGNLNITGDVDSVSVTDLDVTDKTITVGVGGTASANDGAGIVVDGASASILWDNSNTSWDFNNPIESSRVNTNTVNNVGNSANIIYRSSTNTIVGNNASALVVQDGGNVGIGTSSVGTKLNIRSDASDDGILLEKSDGTDIARLFHDGTTTNARFDMFSGGSATVQIKASGNTHFSGGNVGIGVSSPSYPLQVDRGATGDIAHFEGQGSVHLRIGEASNVMYLNANNGNAEIAFRSNDSEKMRINSSGNVGIGRTDPQAKLHIEVADNTEFLKATITGNESWAFKGASGSGATDYVSFGLSGSTQCMTWQEDGNVGIGTSSPQKALDIAGASSSGGAVMRLSGTGEASQGDVTGAIQFYSADTTDNTPGVFGMLRGIAGASGGEGSLQILTDMPSEGADASNITMHFHSNGNVGIGNTSPTSNLTIGSSQSDGLEFTYDSSNSYRNRISNYWNSNTDTRMDFEIGRTGNVAPTTVMSVGYSGNVGIGTSSPAYKLEVESSSDADLIQIQSTAGANNTVLRLGISGDVATLNASGGSSGTLAIKTYGTERMRIDSSGKLLIGTDTSDANDLLQIETPASGGGHGIQIRRNDANSDQGIGRILFGNASDNDLAMMSATTDGSTTNARLGFFTQPNGGSLTERMRIDASGNLFLNTTSAMDACFVQFTDHSNGEAFLGLSSKDDNNVGIRFGVGTTRKWVNYRDTSNNLIWYDNAAPAERMRIDSSGKVGIGTGSPSEALHIEYNTVSGGDNYIHMRKTDQGAGQGIFIGMPTASNNLQIMNHANNAITFHTQTSDAERFRIDTNGVRLEDGAMAYEQNRPFFSGANASSYSSSTNLAYTKSTDQYSITGEAFKARVRARAYTKYVHMKTNLSSDNIMFFFRIYGYFYNYGVNECVRGGYTYNTNQVIQEAVANAYNTNSNYTIGDFYRSSSGNYLCVRLDVHQTGYTEGEALVFFGSHANSVTRELEITDMQHRDDGNNAY